VFTGVAVALVTLFDGGGGLDAPATADHAERLVDLGMQAIVVAGSTGEAAALSPEERDDLVSAVVKAVEDRVPVIAGTGAPSARQAVELTRRAVAHGATAVLALSPPGSLDARPYYERVVDAAEGIPVLGYHFPSVSPPGISIESLVDLPIAGLKDSTGDPDRLLAELEVFDRPLYVGSSAILALAGPLGCAGAILALANAEPELCVSAFAGDAAAQRRLAPAHLEARRSFPAGIKALTAKRFHTSQVARMG
jgi:4-hydroxy-tetrahydrodipicolinate synthase